MKPPLRDMCLSASLTLSHLYCKSVYCHLCGLSFDLALMKRENPQRQYESAFIQANLNVVYMLACLAHQIPNLGVEHIKDFVFLSDFLLQP